MKVLVLAQPRTASKFVADNLVRYFGDTQDLSPSFLYDPIDGALSAHRRGPNVRQGILEGLRTIEACTTDLVVKGHPNDVAWNCPLLQRLMKLFDHTVLLRRRDPFEMLLSQALALESTHWYPSEEQSRAKLRYLRNPIMVDPARFFELLCAHLQGELLPINVNVEVFAEDLLSITPEGFCDALQLPQRPFTLLQHGREFGAYKRAMIANLHQLEALYQVHSSKFMWR